MRAAPPAGAPRRPHPGPGCTGRLPHQARVPRDRRLRRARPLPQHADPGSREGARERPVPEVRAARGGCRPHRRQLARARHLQLLCKACHKEKTAENLVPAPLEIRERIAQLMFDRLAPGRPRLLADDDTTWADIWRGLKRARRQRLLDLLEENGIDPRGLKSRAEMIAALDDEHEEDDEWEGVDDEGSSASIRRPRGTTTAAMAPTATSPARCTATTELKLSRRHLLPGTRRGLPQTCGTPVRSPVSLGVQARRR